MNSPSVRRAVRWATAFVLVITGSIAAGADVVGGAHGVSLSRASANAQSVRITGPNGYSNVSSNDSVRAAKGAVLVDGVYRYEVTETQCVSVNRAKIAAAKRDNAANGRDKDAQPSSCREVVVDSGSFRIVNGAVPNSALAEE